MYSTYTIDSVAYKSPHAVHLTNSCRCRAQRCRNAMRPKSTNGEHWRLFSRLTVPALMRTGLLRKCSATAIILLRENVEMVSKWRHYMYRTNVWLTLFRLTVVTVHVPVTCDAEDTVSLDGIAPVVGVPASRFRLVLSAV